jgi:protein CMS1
MSDSDEGGVPLIEAEFDTALGSKKRKRTDEPENSLEAKKAKKKAKRKLKKKQREKDINEDDLDQDLGINHAFERMDSQLLADYINSRTRHYGKDLSSVELEEKFIPSMYPPQDVATCSNIRTKAIRSKTRAAGASTALWIILQLS